MVVNNARFRSFVILLNGHCNLRCKYCFINKENAKVFEEITKELIELIDSGYYPKRIQEIFPERDQLMRFDRMEFWGGEPLLNSEHMAKAVNQMLDVTPNIRHISFSSNFALTNSAERLIEFLAELKEIHETRFPHSDPFYVSMQISVDGPYAFTDRNRGDLVSAQITKNFEKLIENFYRFDGNHVSFRVHTHGVTDTESLEMFCDKENIYHFFDYFYHLEEIVMENNVEFHNKNHDIICVPGNVMQFPTAQTSENGKIAEKAFRTLYEFYNEDKPSRWNDRFWRYLRGWYPGDCTFGYPVSGPYYRDFNRDKAIEILNTSKKEIITHEIQSHPERRTYCGVGHGNILIGPRGIHPLCQNVAFDIYYEYLQQFEGKNAVNSSFIGNNNAVYGEEINRWIFQNIDEYRKFSHGICMAYDNINDGGYYGNELMARATIELLAKTGIIDRKYKDAKERNYAAKFCDSSCNCMAQMLNITGSIFLPIMNLYPLYLNGAMDWIDKLVLIKIERELERYEQ